MTSLAPMPCRSCRAPVSRVFLDLGETPLANAYPAPDSSSADEARFPLRARLCDACSLVQLDHVVDPVDIFSDYAYFSSYSDSWNEHAERFAAWAVDALGLGPKSLAVEVASNDGYLLRHLADRGVPVLGVEPAANVAAAAVAAGVPTEVLFFGAETAAALLENGHRADLLIGNNVLAHVPDVRDFTLGLATLLAPGGVLSMEFPHLLRLLAGVQFDTVYHEHFSYLSLLAVEHAFTAAGLRVFEVAELPTHGGSLRVLAQRSDDPPREEGAGLRKVRDDERAARLDDPRTYEGFADTVAACRRSLRAFLAKAREEGRTVVAYGAAAKGNTLLNFCGVGTDDIAYVVDRSPHKQDRLLPGSRLPIRSPDAVRETRPDYLLILPWNLQDEIRAQMSDIAQWGGRFVVPVPETRVLE